MGGRSLAALVWFVGLRVCAYAGVYDGVGRLDSFLASSFGFSPFLSWTYVRGSAV